MNKTTTYLLSAIISIACISVSADNSSASKDETTKAMELKPNLKAGKEMYELCATCHNANGWGKVDGSFPVIAGQHRSVIIKQLADIRARNRENPTMYPFSGDDVLGGPQGMEDVAGYISQLPFNPTPGTGKDEDTEKGKKLYVEKCASCHGMEGEGNAKAFFPRIQGQHYAYLLRQLQWMRDGRRKNANAAMLMQINKMDDATLASIANYISRIEVKVSQPES